jgi:hypothetical protein
MTNFCNKILVKNTFSLKPDNNNKEKKVNIERFKLSYKFYV